MKIKYYITELTPEVERIINAKIVSCVIIEKIAILARFDSNKTELKTILRNYIENK